MVFQSLLSTVTTSASSGFLGSTFSGGGSPPEGGAALCSGKDTPAKHSTYHFGSVRTFHDLPQMERSTRRPVDMLVTEHQCGRASCGEVEASAPTVGWWKWHAVPTNQGAASEDQAKDGRATLYAMEQSLSSWEKGANERLNDWQHAEEVRPIFRTSRNYGTFTRRDFLYSGTACAPARPAAPEESASCAVVGWSSSRGSGASTRPSQSSEGVRASNHDLGVESRAKQGFFEHTLRSGDTLSALAVKYQVQVNDIARANGISGMGSQASLLVRKSLRIPLLSSSGQNCTPKDETKEEQVISVVPAKGEFERVEPQRPSVPEKSALVAKEKRRTGEEEKERRTKGAGAQPVLQSYQCWDASLDASRHDPIAARLASIAAAVSNDAQQSQDERR